MNTPNKSQEINRLRGFTLIELLVVVTIIVVLSGLTIGISGYVQGKAAVSKAQTQIKLLENALEQYAADANGLPEVEDETGLVIYMMLFGDGVGPDGVLSTLEAQNPQLTGVPSEGARVYLADLDPRTNIQKMLRVQDDIPTALVDPWGSPWRFRSGDGIKVMNPDFDLWSAGPDGDFDTLEDNVKNW